MDRQEVEEFSKAEKKLQCDHRGSGLGWNEEKDMSTAAALAFSDGLLIRRQITDKALRNAGIDISAKEAKALIDLREWRWAERHHVGSRKGPLKLFYDLDDLRKVVRSGIVDKSPVDIVMRARWERARLQEKRSEWAEVRTKIAAEKRARRAYDEQEKINRHKEIHARQKEKDASRKLKYPLHYAIKWGEWEEAKKIISPDNVNIIDRGGYLPIAMHNNIPDELVRLMVEKGLTLYDRVQKVRGSDRKESAYEFYARTNTRREVKTVLLGMQEKEKKGNPLNGQVLQFCKYRKHATKLKEILHQGGDVNERNKSKKTPLILAIEHHNVDGVRVLLQFHPDLEKRDKNDLTALQHAINPYDLPKGSSIEIIQLLVAKGATLHSLDSRRQKIVSGVVGNQTKKNTQNLVLDRIVRLSMDPHRTQSIEREQNSVNLHKGRGR